MGSIPFKRRIVFELICNLLNFYCSATIIFSFKYEWILTLLIISSVSQSVSPSAIQQTFFTSLTPHIRHLRKTRRKLGPTNVRTEFWDCYWGQRKNCQQLTGAFSNYPRNNCGTHFGSSLPLISKVANDWRKQYLIHFRLALWWWLLFSAQEVEQMPTPLTREKWRKSTSNDSFFTCKSFYQSKYDLHWVINKFLF